MFTDPRTSRFNRYASYYGLSKLKDVTLIGGWKAYGLSEDHETVFFRHGTSVRKVALRDAQAMARRSDGAASLTKPFADGGPNKG